MNDFHSTVTVSRIKELFNYDPETGIFTRRISVNSSDLAGDVAGSVDGAGHIRLSVDFCGVMAHRAAIAITTGEWPKADVDHINGVPGDNRLINLREVSRSHNLQNQRRSHKDSASGVLGVKMETGKKRTKWSASIYANGKANHLGTFLTVEEASDAYISAKRKLHPGCTI